MLGVRIERRRSCLVEMENGWVGYKSGDEYVKGWEYIYKVLAWWVVE